MSHNNESVRVALGTEVNAKAPYFHAPYPDRLVQVHEGETEGERNVIELINEHWPVPITELEQIAKEKYDGYSGAFIRNVLRNKFIPADEMDTREEMEGIEPPVGADDEWRVFRMGLRVALEGNVEEDVAYEAFTAGYVEGMKVKGEIDEETKRMITTTT